MPRASATRELLASREDVWAFLAEPHHFPDWWPDVAAVEPGRRGLVEGARWHVHGKDRPTLLRRPASSGMLLVTAARPLAPLGWVLGGGPSEAGARRAEKQN